MKTGIIIATVPAVKIVSLLWVMLAITADYDDDSVIRDPQIGVFEYLCGDCHRTRPCSRCKGPSPESCQRFLPYARPRHKIAFCTLVGVLRGA
jgi:hypothetical protein